MKKNDHDTTTRLSLGTVLPGASKIDVSPSQNFTREQKKKERQRIFLSLNFYVAF